MSVKLDGEEIGSVAVRSPKWEEYAFSVNTDGGIKVLGITYENDGSDWRKPEDRNLYIGGAKAIKK